MEAPRGAREPTGTNGPTPHQPPQPGTHPPNGEHRHKGGPGTASPTHRTGASTGGRATRHPPPPPGPQTRAKQRQQGGGTKEPQPLYEPRPTHPPPNPPHDGPGHPATRRANKRGGRTTQSCGGHSTGETPSNIPNLEAKPGRANGTAPQGVWESRKPPQHTTRRGAAHTSAAPPHTPTRAPNQPTRTRATTHRHTQRRGHTPTHADTQHARATTQQREEYRTHARNTTTQNQPSSTRRLVWT